MLHHHLSVLKRYSLIQPHLTRFLVSSIMSDTPENTMLASGRHGKRGRGRGGGRGRGARGAHTSSTASARSDTVTSLQKTGNSNSSMGEKARTASRNLSQKPWPTHCKCHIKHHLGCRHGFKLTRAGAIPTVISLPIVRDGLVQLT